MMMNEGIMQEALSSDVSMSPAALPPLNNLPQWSRVNTLDKARYPKPFLKDRLQPLPNPSDESSPVESEAGEAISPRMKVLHLEKSIQFLRQQHKDILMHLHEEIDKLKRENKELQFRLVCMNSSGASPDTFPDPVPVQKSEEQSSLHDSLQDKDSLLEKRDSKSDELKLIFMEEEIRELKVALKDERKRNQYLTQMVEQLQSKHLSNDRGGVLPPHPPQRNSSSAHSSNQSSDRQSEGEPKPKRAGMYMGPLPFNATLNPLQVHVAPQPPRPPTLQECQKILLHMQNVNDKQSHELNQLKSDLRDVLYSHKWTPDAYLLAKAYVAEDDAKEAAHHDRLPRIAMKQPSRKLPDVAYIQRDALSLPALKQTMGNKAIERRKRTQILHKSRFGREAPAPWQPEVSEG